MRAVIGLLLLAAAFAAADSPRFTIGVLRRDGVAVPFATYDGKAWAGRWPAPAREPEIPINLRSVPSKWLDAPVASTWSTWIDGRAGSAVRVLGPDVIETHC